MSAFDVIIDDDAAALSKILKEEGLHILSFRNSKKETLLHRAAAYASLDCMKLLLEHHEDALDLHAVNTWNETALHLLAGSGDAKTVECCKLLLEAAVGSGDYSLLTKEDQWGRTAMSVALDYNEGKDQAQRGYGLQPIARCISAVSPPEEIGHAIRTSMDKYEANKEKETIGVEKTGAAIIVDRDTLKTEREKLKKTETVVKTIFSGGGGGGGGGAAKENAVSGSQRKPLSSCLEYPVDFELLRALVAKGAEINISGKDAFGLNILHKLAAWNASAEAFNIVFPFLEEEAFSACDVENGFTPLHHALMSGNLEIAACLLAHNLDLKDVKASREGSQSALEMLLAQPSNEIVDKFVTIFEKPL